MQLVDLMNAISLTRLCRVGPTRATLCQLRDNQGDAVPMSSEIEVGPASELTPGTVTGAGPYAVGNSDGDVFAVTRRCRHLYADLANGSLDEGGCLVCPWHGSKYDVDTGRMVRGPQGVFAKIPGLQSALKALTVVLPLGRGRVVERDETVYVE